MQSIRLEESPRYPINAEDIGGISSPDQHPESSSNLVFSATLNNLSGESSDLDSVGKCYGSGIQLSYLAATGHGLNFTFQPCQLFTSQARILGRQTSSDSSA